MSRSVFRPNTVHPSSPISTVLRRAEPAGWPGAPKWARSLRISPQRFRPSPAPAVARHFATSWNDRNTAASMPRQVAHLDHRSGSRLDTVSARATLEQQRRGHFVNAVSRSRPLQRRSAELRQYQQRRPIRRFGPPLWHRSRSIAAPAAANMAKATTCRRCQIRRRWGLSMHRSVPPMRPRRHWLRRAIWERQRQRSRSHLRRRWMRQRSSAMLSQRSRSMRLRRSRLMCARLLPMPRCSPVLRRPWRRRCRSRADCASRSRQTVQTAQTTQQRPAAGLPAGVAGPWGADISMQQQPAIDRMTTQSTQQPTTFGQKLGNFAQRNLPAIAGTMIAGPVGGLIGGLLGRSFDAAKPGQVFGNPFQGLGNTARAMGMFQSGTPYAGPISTYGYRYAGRLAMCWVVPLRSAAGPIRARRRDTQSRHCREAPFNARTNMDLRHLSGHRWLRQRRPIPAASLAAVVVGEAGAIRPMSAHRRWAMPARGAAVAVLPAARQAAQAKAPVPTRAARARARRVNEQCRFHPGRPPPHRIPAS